MPADAAGRRRVVRAPNHLGDVVMALPALAEDGSDVMVRAWLAPLLRMAGLPAAVLPLERGWGGWRGAVKRLRGEGYRAGTLLTPSFSAAWLFRWGGVARLRGTATDARSWMLTERVPREALRGHHRVNQYRMLLGQDTARPPRYPVLTPPADAVAVWQERVAGDGPLVGIFPGSNAPSRRWPVDRFAEVARALVARGYRVVAMGSVGERPLTAALARTVPGLVDVGGATDVPGLAALLSVCRLVVTNDTGPMHLAAAVGAPTVTLWGPSDPAEVAPQGPEHDRAGGPSLPCRPCFKNQCPRSGPGTVLKEGHEECMRLIEADQVLGAALALLEDRTS